MSKVRITENTIVQGVGHVGQGTILNVDPRIARQLFVAGKAVPCADKPAKPTTRKKAGKK